MENIEVYTINNCGYCEAAKALLNNKDLSFKEINIANDDAMKSELIAKTGHRTMPQIFIDGEFIGGYVELKEFLKRA
jgi:glutaredoxin 3